MTADKPDLHFCFLYLLPGASCGIVDNDYERVEWMDERPMPSEAEVAAVWPIVKARMKAEEWNRGIKKQLDALDADKLARALSEALLGDKTRLEALEAIKAPLRAQLRAMPG
jgi:hypothetical protein